MHKAGEVANQFDVQRARAAMTAAFEANSIHSKTELIWAGGSVVFRADDWAVRILPASTSKQSVELQARMARHLSDHGVACIQLAEDVAQPIVATGDGLVSFWNWVNHDGSCSLTPTDKGALVRKIHDLPAEPWMPRANLFQVARIRLTEIRQGEIATADELEILTRHLDDATTLWATLTDPGLAHTVVHGDVQDANILIGDDGPVLCDLENIGVGHAELDLVKPIIEREMFGQSPAFVDDWFSGYGVAPNDTLETLAIARAVRTVIWCVWARPMGEQWVHESKRRIADLERSPGNVKWRPMSTRSVPPVDDQD